MVETKWKLIGGFCFIVVALLVIFKVVPDIVEGAEEQGTPTPDEVQKICSQSKLSDFVFECDIVQSGIPNMTRLRCNYKGELIVYEGEIGEGTCYKSWLAPNELGSDFLDLIYCDGENIEEAMKFCIEQIPDSIKDIKVIINFKS